MFVSPTKVKPTALQNVGHWVDPEPWIDLADVNLAHDLEAYIHRDALPIPPTANREGYHGERHYDYWLSGLKDYLLIKTRVQPYLPTLGQDTPILDFGCATGRVLRHFHCQEEGIPLWGCDLNVNHISWNTQYLGTGIRFFPNTIYPSLPLEDRSVALVYAMSVFTHIDDYELAWLAELRRVLKPGGIAYVTVHTDHTWQAIGPNHALYYVLMWLKSQNTGYNISDELFAKPMPEERIAFTWKAGDHKEANVFHAEKYLRSQWSNYFDVLEIIHEGSDYQDVVLLRKPAAHSTYS